MGLVTWISFRKEVENYVHDAAALVSHGNGSVTLTARPSGRVFGYF